MFEDDPAKRLEMIREELVNQGKSWDRLIPAEKNYIEELTGFNQEQLQSALASKDAVKALEAVKALPTANRFAKFMTGADKFTSGLVLGKGVTEIYSGETPMESFSGNKAR